MIYFIIMQFEANKELLANQHQLYAAYTVYN